MKSVFALTKNKKLLLLLAAIWLWSIFFVLILPHQIKADETQYVLLAKNLLSGKGYSLSTSAPYEPSNSREPLYPLFLAFSLALSRNNYFFAQLCQTIIYVLTIYLILRINQSLFGEKLAWKLTLAIGLFPTLANFPRYFLSESLFTFLLALLVFVFLKACSTKRLGYYILSGVVLGLASLCRAVILLFILPLLAIVPLINNDINFKQSFLRAFTLLVFFLLTISPWMARNYCLFGQLNISERLGRSLWMRAATLDYPKEEFKKMAIYSFSEYLGNKYYPEESPETYLLKEAYTSKDLMDRLKKEGLNEPQIDAYLAREALAKIKEKPLIYLRQSVVELIKLTGFTYLPILNEGSFKKKFIHNRVALSIMKGCFKSMGYFLSFLSVLGLLLSLKQWRKWIFIVFLIGYFLFIQSLNFADARYLAPLIPYYFILSAVAIVKMPEFKLKTFR